jgi:hypothetical protein
MKKTKTKPKSNLKEAGGEASRGQVVRIKPGKARPGWFSKVPPVKQYWAQSKNFLSEAVQELKRSPGPTAKRPWALPAWSSSWCSLSGGIWGWWIFS